MGAEQAHGLETRWRSLDGKVDADRFAAVSAKLHQQVADAEAWRDKCVRYFQQFTSGSSR
jgi:alpha-glucuronidase